MRPTHYLGHLNRHGRKKQKMLGRGDRSFAAFKRLITEKAAKGGIKVVTLHACPDGEEDLKAAQRILEW